MQAKKARFAIGSIGLLVGVALLAAPAFGQVAFTATSFAQNVRVDGQTEAVGAITLTTTAGGTIAGGAAPSGSNIIITYGAAIPNASGVVTFAAGTGGAPQTSSGGAAPFGSNAGDFTLTTGGNSLSIGFGATDTLPAGASITISQVRLNIAALGVPAGTPVFATLSGTAPSGKQITFTSSQVQVALVNTDITTGFTAAAASLTSCNIPAAGATFNVKVTEKFPGAVTSLADELNFTPALPAGYTNGGLTPKLPVQGTTLAITISNIPNGLTVTGPTAVDAGGGFTTAAASPASIVSTASGTSQTFTFAVTGNITGSSRVSGFTFTVTPTTGTSIPVIGGTSVMTAAVSIAPVSSATGNVVNFATNSYGSGTALTVGDCVTNLLFPFVTNQFGFDTQIQIANTSLDKAAFGTQVASVNSGTCVLTLYPTDLTAQTASAAGTQASPAALTTTSVAAGTVYSTSMSTAFPNQSGFMYAVCRFLDAHGFSYVLNGPAGTATVSQGLLALVVPNPAPTPRTNPGCFVTSTTAAGTALPVTVTLATPPNCNPGGGSYEVLGH